MSHIYVSLPPALFEIVGIAGFALYVLNYALLTLHRLTSRSKTYFVINIFAASFVLIGLTQSFNLASALIQGFWILISITAVIVRLRPAKDEAAAPQSQLA